MKTSLKTILPFILISSILLTSCRTEETESIEPPVEETLEANSVVANLMQRTATNDGSNDNIIDNANCFNIQYPVTVVVNGNQIVVNSDDDLDDIEVIFDADDDDTDTLVIMYPITIILDDFTEVVINNDSEFLSYASTCNDENEYDDDIECLDFVYPLSASIFNTNDELIETVIISNDSDLYNFIEDIDEDDIITIDFPIVVVLSDGTQMIINNLNELATVIANAEDDCDEDDDYDYNDDDCDNCNPIQFTNIITSCSDWIVDKLERNNNDLEDTYIGYVFNFFNDGTIQVDWASVTAYGTWSASGSGNDIVVVIDIPDLPDCNNNWILHEIEEYTGETKFDLRLGDDRLRYESDCN